MATALIVLTSFAMLGSITTALSYRRTMADKEEMMAVAAQGTARFIATQHRHYDVSLDDLSLSMLLTMTSGVTGFDFLVANADGVVAACSDRVLVNKGRQIPDGTLQTVRASDAIVIMTSTLGNIYEGNRQISAVPLAMDSSGTQEPFGFLFVTSDTAAFRQEWQTFLNAFIMTALCIMAFAFVISFVSTKRETQPLNDMASAARRFARGEFEARVKNKGRKDEIGQLTEAFNMMADSLEHSEEMRRDFIANLSHELKTPMTIISGFADGLLDGTVPRKDEERYLAVISSETKRMSRLVKNMLELSTLHKVETDAVLENSFDITEVVRLALVSLDGKINEKKLDIKADIPEHAVMTYGDEDSIMQVVYNLIDNAVKFSENGELINLELWKHMSQVYVSVENRGETIPEEELPQIFERFHKTDKSRSVNREGVGLGLYIVKTILDNHHEDIFVTSKDGVTKFVFSLTAV